MELHFKGIKSRKYRFHLSVTLQIPYLEDFEQKKMKLIFVFLLFGFFYINAKPAMKRMGK